MKISKFNSTLQLSDKYRLHYNALTDSFLLSKNDFKISLETDSKALQVLTEKGFIVEDQTDEDEILRARAESVIMQESSFNLIINPTLDCNFSCWYCYEEKRKGAIMKQPILSSVLRLINHLAAHYKHIHISFFGGEPLLGFQTVIKPIFAGLEAACKDCSCDYSASFTTNGSLLTDNMLSYLENVHVNNMQITLDGHKELHNATRFFAKHQGSYDIILENIVKLLQKDISVTLRLNYTPENIHTMRSIVDDIVKIVPTNLRGILLVRLHQVWQTCGVEIVEDVDDLLECFIEHGILALKPVYNNVKSPCYADYKNSALVNYDGNVFKCTAVDFLNTPREGYISSSGEIVWENDSLNRRVSAKFKNKACNECRIQPLCNGGCSQKAMHCASTNYCILDFDDAKKDRIIQDRFVANLCAKRVAKLLNA